MTVESVLLETELPGPLPVTVSRFKIVDAEEILVIRKYTAAEVPGATLPRW
jgi:hypothetical protein